MSANAVAISPDSDIVASGGADGTVIIRPMDEIAAGQGPGTVLTYTGSTGVAVTTMAFSPDGQILVSGDDHGNLVVWDGPAGTLGRVAGLVVDGIIDLAFDPAGRILATGESGGNVRLWDTEEWTPSGGVFRGPASGISALSYDRDGETLVAVGPDGLRQPGHEHLQRDEKCGRR